MIGEHKPVRLVISLSCPVVLVFLFIVFTSDSDTGLQETEEGFKWRYDTLAIVGTISIFISKNESKSRASSRTAINFNEVLA